MTEKLDIIIVMEGGLIQSVVSGNADLIGATVTIVDYDTDGTNDSELTDIHDKTVSDLFPHGNWTQALVREETIEQAAIEIVD